MAISPAHWGEEALVPPIVYQPVLQGLAPPQPVPELVVSGSLK
jgi:hypothetical protein